VIIVEDGPYWYLQYTPFSYREGKFLMIEGSYLEDYRTWVRARPRSQ